MGFWYKKPKGKKEKKKKKRFFCFFLHFAFCILMGERLYSVLEEGFRVSFWDLGVGRFCSEALQILGRRFYHSIA